MVHAAIRNFKQAAGNWQPRDKLGTGWQKTDILFAESLLHAASCLLSAASRLLNSDS
jgi:hypothetical protein